MWGEACGVIGGLCAKVGVGPKVPGRDGPEIPIWLQMAVTVAGVSARLNKATV